MEIEKTIGNKINKIIPADVKYEFADNLLVLTHSDDFKLMDIANDVQNEFKLVEVVNAPNAVVLGELETALKVLGIN